MNATPHVAQNDKRRRSAIDGRVTRHAGYAVSQTIRKSIEEVFGLGKEVGRMRHPVPRPAARRPVLRLHGGRLQSRAPAQAHRPVMGETTIVGKWRLLAMSTWDRDYIDLVEPDHIAFAVRDMGEMAFGVVTAPLDRAFDKTRCDVSFDFTGFDEGDEISGQGCAEMTSPDTITGEIEFRNRDDTTFEGRRW